MRTAQHVQIATTKSFFCTCPKCLFVAKRNYTIAYVLQYAREMAVCQRVLLHNATYGGGPKVRFAMQMRAKRTTVKLHTIVQNVVWSLPVQNETPLRCNMQQRCVAYCIMGRCYKVAYSNNTSNNVRKTHW